MKIATIIMLLYASCLVFIGCKKSYNNLEDNISTMSSADELITKYSHDSPGIIAVNCAHVYTLFRKTDGAQLLMPKYYCEPEKNPDGTLKARP